jgi:PPP family 3-phenylpropionic acid transporter
LNKAQLLRPFPWLRWLVTKSPLVWGCWFYAGLYGIVGAYIGFLNVYFIRAGFSEVAVGFLNSVPPLLMLVVAPPVAAWADRHARRVPLVCVAMLGMGLSLLAMYWAKGPAVLVATFFGLSLGYSLVIPLGDGLVARLAAQHRLEYGRMRAWGSLSFALASALFGWLWGQVGYQPMFWIAGVLMILLAPSALVLDEAPAPPQGERFNLLVLLQDRGLLIVLLIALFFGLGLGFTDPFLGVSMERLGGTPFMIGLLFLCIALPELPTMHFEQTLARRIGDGPALMLGGLVFAVGYGALALVRTPIQMLGVAPLLGVGFGLIFVGTVRLVDLKASPGRISTLQSIRHALAFGITPLLTGPIGGAVYERVGQSFFWLTVACLLLLLGVAWWGRKELG